MNKNNMMTRSITSFTADDDYKISGKPVVCGQITDMGGYLEVIEEGALAHTDISDICLLENHKLNMIPYARFRQGDTNSTMNIYVDRTGMSFDASLDKENPRAQEAHSGIKRGDIDKMSFCFWIDWDTAEWDESGEKPLLRIKNITKILEISIVNWPAYDGTSVGIARDENGTDLLEVYKQMKQNEQLVIEKARLL